ncbi:flagellar basal-body MS-ring/collar protein FliF [Legionella nagasakiensis]|uniref:flagellar basal-body MS-ring/collar protein FliF n=1 Tax=Legionella nagasakiensis TaxID=535290 RepID=UPI001054282E|nr:flagellar basal-body MS-ring/collar protein FliF [Legionella nagasakiensis]
MEKKFESILETIKSLFEFNLTRRLFFLAGIAISVTIGFSMYQWIQEPIYRPLNYRVNDQNFASIIEVLEKSSIKYKVNDINGTISVPAKDINLAKIRLSSAGIAKEDGFTFSFLNEKNKFGSSNFIDNARYIRALEADLAKTISSIQGISNAKVHIAVPQNNIFANNHAKTTASIIINLAPGYEEDKEKIRAIIQLVAASVPSLDPKDVSITDQYGHYLSSMSDQDSMLNQEHLNYQNNLQRYYEKRIQSLIYPMVGENKASISVNTEIDFTQKEESKEEYDPEHTPLRSEQSVMEQNSSTGAAGVPGALSNQAPNNNNNAQNPAGQQTGQSRNELIKNYEVSKSTHYVKATSPKIKRISVAVVLDNEMVYDEDAKKTISKPLDEEKIKKITELVKSAVGYHEERGDTVTVINSGFIIKQPVSESRAWFWEEPWFWDLFKKLSGIILGFTFLFILYRKFSSELVKNKNQGTNLTDPNAKNFSITPEMLKLKNQQLQILQDMVDKDPNKVVGVIKKWIAK